VAQAVPLGGHQQPPHCVPGKDTVCFRWRDYAGGNLQEVIRLGHEEFIWRFLQHVLPAGFCKIRYYGI